MSGTTPPIFSIYFSPDFFEPPTCSDLVWTTGNIDEIRQIDAAMQNVITRRPIWTYYVFLRYSCVISSDAKNIFRFQKIYNILWDFRVSEFRQEVRVFRFFWEIDVCKELCKSIVTPMYNTKLISEILTWLFVELKNCFGKTHFFDIELVTNLLWTWQQSVSKMRAKIDEIAIFGDEERNTQLFNHAKSATNR